MNFFTYSYNEWKFKDKNSFLSCPFQYAHKNGTLKCDRDMGICDYGDPRKCEYIPKHWLSLVLIGYFFTRFFWRNINETVKKKKK